MIYLRSWFFSILTIVAFGSTLLFYDIRGRLAIRRGLRAFERTMASLQGTLLRVFAISGVTVDVEGLEHFNDQGGYIFVSNHQSMFDVPIFGGILTRNYPKYVAKKELSKGIPSISLNLRVGGNALIDRGERKQAVAAIAELGQACQDRDVSAVIFPEGTRSRDGTLGDYRLLGLSTLMKSADSLAIVPTVIDGSWRVFEHNMLPVPYGAAVRIRFGEPILRGPDESPGDVADRCREFAASTLAEWLTDGNEA
jgi:1-acyl-sn-glycerol-3-phosphate acyltransferase